MEKAVRPDKNNGVRICAVIPAYNESATIGSIIKGIIKYVGSVYVIDDGSTDNTAKVAKENGAKVIKHSINYGIGYALQSGYDAASHDEFDYIVQVDGDGQHNPKYIPEMLKIAQGCDFVIGSRFLNNSHRDYPFIRRLGISFFTLVVNLLASLRLSDVTSGYRVYKTESLRRLHRISTGHWAIEQTLEAGKRGFKIKEVSIEMPPRRIGKSQFSFFVYCLYPLRMMWAILKVEIRMRRRRDLRQ